MKKVEAKVVWTYHENGNSAHEEYRIDDKYHNPNGPAYRSWYDNGKLEYEEYWIDNKRHNPNGPAYRCWHDNGKLAYEAYWIDGKYLTKEQFENRNKTCEGKVVEIDGKKYKLQEVT